jgi:hypothetical protein
MSPRFIDGRMRGADAFNEAAFIGTARSARRDPYRLSLFGEHLSSGERPLVVLPIHGGTLLATDLRLLELRAHLEVHGAWNVKQFQGYAVHREIQRTAVRDVIHAVGPGMDATENRRIDDRITVVTDHGPEEFLVSHGPEPTLTPSEFEALRAAVLGPQAK